MRRLRKTSANLNNDRMTGWRTVRRVVPYLWPEGEPGVKWRVCLAVGLLVAAKLVAVTTPLFFKWAVDTLGTEADVPAPPPKRGIGIVIAVAVGMAIFGALAVGIGATRTTPAPVAGSLVAPASSPSVVVAPIVSTAASVPAPVAEEVEVRIEGLPDGTVVSADGTRIESAGHPMKLARGKAVKLSFAAKGYKAKDMLLTPTENTMLSVTLEKAPATVAAPPKPAGKIHSDLEGF